MKPRQLLWMGVCVAGLAGCQPGTPPTAKATPAAVPAPVSASPTVAPKPAEPAPVVERPIITEPVAETPAPAADDASRAAVAARAERYAKDVEAAVARKAATDAAPQAARPSAVEWNDLLQANAPATAGPRPAETPQAAATPVTRLAPRPTANPPAAGDGPTAAAPSPGATAFSATAANAGASVGGGADGDPVVVPEGQEFGELAPPVVPAPPEAKAAEDPSLASHLAKRVKENPRDVAAHLDYQLYQFALGRSVPQLAPLAPLPTEDREVVAAVLDGLSNFRTAVQSDNNQLLSKKIAPLVEMSDRLRAAGDLSVPTIALCRRVDSFGNYDPFDPAEFPRGRETPVILYCEVANFSSSKAAAGRWETTLAHSATLYKDSGVPVWSDKTTTVSDTARNRRHDFFVVKRLNLPATLTTGRYVLKVTVVDRQSNRMAEGSMTLSVVGSKDEIATQEMGK